MSDGKITLGPWAKESTISSSFSLTHTPYILGKNNFLFTFPNTIIPADSLSTPSLCRHFSFRPSSFFSFTSTPYFFSQFILYFRLKTIYIINFYSLKKIGQVLINYRKLQNFPFFLLFLPI